MKHKKPISSTIQSNFAVELMPESDATIILQKMGVLFKIFTYKFFPKIDEIYVQLQNLECL
jgi:hypothetical protein